MEGSTKEPAVDRSPYEFAVTITVAGPDTGPLAGLGRILGSEGKQKILASHQIQSRTTRLNLTGEGDLHEGLKEISGPVLDALGQVEEQLRNLRHDHAAKVEELKSEIQKGGARPVDPEEATAEQVGEV